MKDIPGFPHYQITEDGKVWSKYRNRFIIPTKIDKHHEYKRIGLNENGKTTRMAIHKLVALVFIPNPNNLPYVDHIDRDKSNNSISNLRWVSQSQNCINKDITGIIKYRHITKFKSKGGSCRIYYLLQIRRNNKCIFRKNFPIHIHTLEEVVKYRNEVVYPQFNIEIDD